MDNHIWLFFIGQLVTAAGVYAGIKGDLRALTERVAEHERRVGKLEEIEWRRLA